MGWLDPSTGALVASVLRWVPMSVRSMEAILAAVPIPVTRARYEHAEALLAALEVGRHEALQLQRELVDASNLVDGDRSPGDIAQPGYRSVGRLPSDRVDDVHSVDDTPEYGVAVASVRRVFVVQWCVVGGVDKELRCPRIWVCRTGHGDCSTFVF